MSNTDRNNGHTRRESRAAQSITRTARRRDDVATRRAISRGDWDTLTTSDRATRRAVRGTIARVRGEV